ncbi:protein-glutamine gamma-glutamyltransferase TgpA [Methylosoma difficile]
MFLLASIGLIVLPHINHIPANLFAFFIVLWGWRFIGIWRPQFLPNNLLLMLIAVVGIALFYNEHQGLFGRDAGTRLFLVGLSLKLMEIKSERDLYLIVYLAFIVASSQFLYEQSLLMAGYILFVCCVLLATLICLNTDKPETQAALKTAGTILLQALPLAIALFILFPRLQAPRWMLLNDTHQARTGLSDTMEPGSITDLGMSDELVFRAKFTGAIPPNQQLYWRGPVFAYTDGKRWAQVSNLHYARFMDKIKVSGTPYQYTLLMEPQNKNWVFALDMPVEYYGALSQNVNYQLITSENPDKRAEYKIFSYPNYNTGYITRTEHKDATQLPSEPSAKIKQLVSQLHGFDSPPENFINQLLNHFRKEDFHYTLTPPAMENNPIETFLFEHRYGFCSHYASAFVYLLRVSKIPARVVTGFQGGEFNKVGGFLEVRQANAHAWAEVWLENKGWVRFDPTAAIAPERIERNINLNQLEIGGLISYLPNTDSSAGIYSWMRKTRQLWSNVDYNWQRWVINYSTDSQAKFLSSLGVGDLKAMLYWLGSIISAITFLLCWLLLYQKKARIDPVLQNYQRFCRKLGNSGVSKHPSEGEKTFALRAAAHLPEHAETILQITDTFIRLRYGRNPSTVELKDFYRQVAVFKNK